MVEVADASNLIIAYSPASFIKQEFIKETVYNFLNFKMEMITSNLRILLFKDLYYSYLAFVQAFDKIRPYNGTPNFVKFGFFIKDINFSFSKVSNLASLVAYNLIKKSNLFKCTNCYDKCAEINKEINEMLANIPKLNEEDKKQTIKKLVQKHIEYIECMYYAAVFDRLANAFNNLHFREYHVLKADNVPIYLITLYDSDFSYPDLNLLSLCAFSANVDLSRWNKSEKEYIGILFYTPYGILKFLKTKINMMLNSLYQNFDYEKRYVIYNPEDNAIFPNANHVVTSLLKRSGAYGTYKTIHNSTTGFFVPYCYIKGLRIKERRFMLRMANICMFIFVASYLRAMLPEPICAVERIDGHNLSLKKDTLYDCTCEDNIQDEKFGYELVHKAYDINILLASKAVLNNTIHIFCFITKLSSKIYQVIQDYNSLFNSILEKIPDNSRHKIVEIYSLNNIYHTIKVGF